MARMGSRSSASAPARDRRPGARVPRPARHPRGPRRALRQALRRHPGRDGRRRARLRRRRARAPLPRPRAHATRSTPTSSSGSAPRSRCRRASPGGQAKRRSPRAFTTLSALDCARRGRVCPGLRPRDREFFDLFEEAGAQHPARGRSARPDAARTTRTARELARDILDLRAGGRPDHARHHPAPQPDVRHPDRPRGHLRAGLGARRHRRLHRGGRRLPRALQDRGADGAGAAAGAHPAAGRAGRSPRRCRGMRDFKRHLALHGRDQPARERRRPRHARGAWPRCSTTASTRWS